MGPVGSAGAALACLLGASPWRGAELAVPWDVAGGAWRSPLIPALEGLLPAARVPRPPADWGSEDEPWSWRSWAWGVLVGACLWPAADALRLARLIWLRVVFALEQRLRYGPLQ